MQEKIYLTITNPGQLLPDVIPRIDFDQSGGTIGSQGSNWLLSDVKNSIAPIHCEIKWVEGSFCVVDRSGNTYLNNTTQTLGLSHIAQLNDGDIIGIGPYKVHVYFSEIQNQLPNPAKSLEQHSLGELVNENQKTLTDHGVLDENVLIDRQDDNYSNAFQELTDSGNESKAEVDPLAALDIIDEKLNELTRKSSLIDPTHFGKSLHAKVQPNYIDTSVEAVSYYDRGPSSETGAQTMENTKSQIQQEWESAYNQESDDAQHLAVFPMQQGLQTNLGNLDSSSAYNMMLEAGKALRATIHGISRLYDEHYSASHNNLALLTRNLQPIEDNPLRLKQSYEETVHSLLSNNRSAVHLSASAAVEESLEQVRKHNNAVIVAIKESLDALLHAFSPTVMQQRFERYRSENHVSHQYDQDSESWRMYINYYNELSSTRQQGFEKLFWEVFQQAYDRTMRESHS